VTFASETPPVPFNVGVSAPASLFVIVTVRELVLESRKITPTSREVGDGPTGATPNPESEKTCVVVASLSTTVMAPG